MCVLLVLCVHAIIVAVVNVNRWRLSNARSGTESADVRQTGAD